MLHDVCDKRKIAIGEDHPLTVVSMKNLVKFYECLGEYDKAKQLEATCHDKEKRHAGEIHTDVIKSLIIQLCHVR